MEDALALTLPVIDCSLITRCVGMAHYFRAGKPAQALPDGTLEVWAVTDHPAATACPGCGTVSGRRHDTVLARPRDVRRGPDPVAVCWVKHRWKCDEPGCARKTFTERVPQVPPRCRLTARLREQAGTEVAGRGITPSEAARHAGISWPVAHEAFAAAADPVLDQAPAPVARLGIDEHRRGRPGGGWTRTPGIPAARRPVAHLLLRPVRRSGAAGPGGGPHRR